MDWEILKGYVGQSFNDVDDTLISDCWDTATALVDRAVGAAEVPDSVLKQAYLTCGAELYNQRSAPNGISQFADGSGQALRVARDPLVGVYPLLRMFVTGIA